MLRRKSDILWKGILESVFDDLLRFLFKDADKVFDLKRGFEFLDKELGEMYPQPEKKPDTRFVDKLAKAYLMDGTEKWVLVHIEVQGESDPSFAERMFKYYCRILDRYNIPITAVAIFTGKNGGNMPDRYERMFLGTELTYKYNTIHIRELSESDLINSDNPFAMVLLASKAGLYSGKETDAQLLIRKRLIIKLLFEKKIPKEKVKNILIFLKNYIRFADPNSNRIFEKEIDNFSKTTKSMNILEQVAEMRAEEATEDLRRKFVYNLLTTTRLPVAKIATAADVTVRYVNSVKRKIKK